MPKEIKISLKDDIKVLIGGIYYSEVVKSGNGAVVKSRKNLLGKKVLVVVVDKLVDKNEILKYL